MAGGTYIGTLSNDANTTSEGFQYGLNGNDVLIPTLSDVSYYLDGGLGDDLLIGRDSADILLGGDGTDRLVGNAGNDRLDGGGGNDQLDGGLGDDLLLASIGDDTLIGG